jgi:hypothetical protein
MGRIPPRSAKRRIRPAQIRAVNPSIGHLAPRGGVRFGVTEFSWLECLDPLEHKSADGRLVWGRQDLVSSPHSQSMQTVSPTPCMPCSFGLLLHPRSGMGALPDRPLGVAVTVRCIPPVTAACGTRVAQPARTTLLEAWRRAVQLDRSVSPSLDEHLLVGKLPKVRDSEALGIYKDRDLLLSLSDGSAYMRQLRLWDD